MKKSVFVVLSLLLIGFAIPVYAISPGFDCQKAVSLIEKTICSSDDLAHEDRKLSDLYQQVGSRLVNPVKKEVKIQQRQWLKSRSDLCVQNAEVNESCLIQLYQQRNQQLTALTIAKPAKASKNPLKLLRISPEGDDVETLNQLVFQFDRPVVALGRMERDVSEIPIVIHPQLNCEWRWLNTSALSCQLKEQDNMQQATRYQVTVLPGFETVKGEGMAESVRHRFTTERPKITHAHFVYWLAPGKPLIRLRFNQAVKRESVISALSFLSQSGKADNNYGVVTYPASQGLKKVLAQPYSALSQPDSHHVWLLAPKNDLPLDAAIYLQVVPGLNSVAGDLSGNEYRTVVKFRTFPEFAMLGIRCTLKGTDRIVDLSLSQLKLSNPQQQCAPLNSVALLFSSPVMNSMVKEQVNFQPALNEGRKNYDPWANSYDWSFLRSAHKAGRVYQVWLPEYLKAFQAYRVSINGDQFKDEFGRALKEGVDFQFMTGHREPRLEMAHQYAVLEKGVDSDVPLYVTNLENVSLIYDYLGDSHSGEQLRKIIDVEPVEDIAYALPLGGRSLMKDDTGMLFARLRPNPTPPNWRYDPKLWLQVTPFQVHFKMGHYNSKLWVTRFDDGLPVAGATVSLWKGSIENVTGLQNLALSAQTNAEGVAELPGRETLDPDLDLLYGGEQQKTPGLFVKIEADQDMAMLPLNDHFSLWISGIYPSTRQAGGHIHSWGTTAQGVYKPGDKIQYKIYLRDQSNRHWVRPPDDLYELKVFDPQDKRVHHREDVRLNPFGALDGEFTAPANGAVGFYRFQLMPKKQAGQKYYRFTWSPMQVLVTDFTPSPFKVATDLNGDLFEVGDQLIATAQATFHAGGAYGEAPLRINARLTAKPFTPDQPQWKGFYFADQQAENRHFGSAQLLDVKDRLDNQGEFQQNIQLSDVGIYYGALTVESAVKDERGKSVAAAARADYAARDLLVGLKNTQWLYQQGQKADVLAAVVDTRGIAVDDVAIAIKIQRLEYKTSKVKGPGNAYLNKSIRVWEDEGQCQLISEEQATACEFIPQKSGSYRFIAQIKDRQKRLHETRLSAWVTGSDYIAWDESRWCQVLSFACALLSNYSAHS